MPKKENVEAPKVQKRSDVMVKLLENGHAVLPGVKPGEAHATPDDSE
jgi:hypothetical protein